MLNMHWDAQDFALPVVPGCRWLVAVDTGQDSPLDIANPGEERPVTGDSYRLSGRSVVVLVNEALV